MDLKDIVNGTFSQIDLDLSSAVEQKNMKYLCVVKTYYPLTKQLGRMIDGYKMIILVPRMMKDDAPFDPQNMVMCAYGVLKSEEEKKAGVVDIPVRGIA